MASCLAQSVLCVCTDLVRLRVHIQPYLTGHRKSNTVTCKPSLVFSPPSSGSLAVNKKSQTTHGFTLSAYPRCILSCVSNRRRLGRFANAYQSPSKIPFSTLCSSALTKLTLQIFHTALSRPFVRINQHKP